MVYVALFARAWIEIVTFNDKYFRSIVALFARAWIEIHDFGYGVVV